MAIVTGTSTSSYYVLRINYSTSSTNATYTVSATLQMYWKKHHSHDLSKERPCYLSATDKGTTNFTPTGSVEKDAGYVINLGSKSWSWSRGKSSASKTIKGYSYRTATGASSTVSFNVTVPAKPSYAVKYYANKPSDATATPTGLPSAQTKWYNEALVLSSTVPTLSDKRFAFKGWATSASGGVAYAKGATVPASVNNALNLYAVWERAFPPTFSTTQKVTGHVKSSSAIKNFSGFQVTVTGITVYESRTINSTNPVKVTIGSQTQYATPTLKSQSGTVRYYNDVTVNFDNLPASGTFTPSVTVKDSKPKETVKSLANVTVVNPTWTKTVTITAPPPEIIAKNGVFDKLEVMDYSVSPSAYKTVTGKFPVTVVSNNEWTFQYTFNESQVSNATSLTPETSVRVSYKHYDVVESESRSSFFRTSRNQNYSNGIYNVMFVSGAEDYPAFTSRVWWSQINNPLYFPDTNYLEVGSNDTMVMGLTKVGDYLAVIKQSKTTDTAIYLLFPTSFEEDTTFAVKQGVQGVGALAKYSFNILGDETLFLSPQGVMAIVPSQDEEHKVQNRSYFVDGRLLKEEHLNDAYSFVHDGKYYLAVNERVYVLDGNQRNSWGNDKTNLVYECYYLTNVPAKCFVKFNDTLVFSNEENVCIVSDVYEDAYDVESREPNAPIKAEWSTILDDDGSLHYYKTMQKKGNLVSVLPRENEQPYKEVTIDEETFNENKTIYFVVVDDEYVRCTEDSVYDQNTQYFIENRTNTKVFVKKDGDDEVEIERSFSISSDIPSEMFLKKKFKKYKRLQFIIRNEAPEAFGVDSIIKNYTVGNYAKK